MLMLQSFSKMLGDASWIYKSGSREVGNYEISLRAINGTALGKRSRKPSHSYCGFDNGIREMHHCPVEEAADKDCPSTLVTCP